MICQFYSKEISITELKEKSSFNGNGVTMLDLSTASESIGFSTLSVTITLDQLIEKSILPCIVYFYNYHFIIVYKISAVKGQTIIHVADPADGLQVYTEEEFKKGWLTYNRNGIYKGHCLMLKPD